MPLYTGPRRNTIAERVPYLRYDAIGTNAGQFSDAQDVDIPFSCLTDFAGIRTGWGLPETGVPPLWVWDRRGHRRRDPVLSDD
jgi:hypothetical protein